MSEFLFVAAAVSATVFAREQGEKFSDMRAVRARGGRVKPWGENAPNFSSSLLPLCSPGKLFVASSVITVKVPSLPLAVPSPPPKKYEKREREILADMEGSGETGPQPTTFFGLISLAPISWGYTPTLTAIRGGAGGGERERERERERETLLFSHTTSPSFPQFEV